MKQIPGPRRAAAGREARSMTQKKVTITDIAKASGVSKTTISRYLNGRFDLMSPETRRRIESVIDVSGYQPSTIARSLKNKRSLLLGIVVSDQSSPFSTAVLLGVGDALRNTEYVPVFVNCDDDPAKERYQISFLLSRGVDGLIVNTTSYENPFLVNLEARGVPVVLCDRYIKGHTFDIVTTDHDSTIRQLLAHLKEQGYGLPALFSQRWDNNSVRLQRRQAFAAGAEALFGLRPGEAPVYEVDGQNQGSAVRALEDLMARCATWAAARRHRREQCHHHLYPARHARDGFVHPAADRPVRPGGLELGRPDELARADSPPAYHSQRAREGNRRHGH